MTSVQFHMLHVIFMSWIYGMKSLIDAAQPQTVWGTHVSTIKRGSLTLAH